jgi:protein-L-isoaspartate O-methyltransferase
MSLPPAYFEAIYARSPDPWGFRSRWYEARKQALVVACLQSERYSTAFEPGCSIGITTASLAARADRLVAMDIAAEALELARAATPPNVELLQGQVPHDWPDGRFDLIVISELAYYLDPSDCARLAELASRAAGELVVVHWRHPVADYPLRGDAVHDIFADSAANEGLHQLLTHAEPDFRIDTWTRDPRSIAQRGGLVR